MDIHQKYMQKCLNISQKAGNKTYPNPLVGCIIVKNNKIIAKGYHKEHGYPHAEVNAINNATENVSGADLYVNLEPCSHFGKTPPCADLIIKSKIKNVYIGMEDPNPLVGGNGIKKLRENGINVYTNILEDKCRELNEPFIKFIQKKEAFITLKIAATLDGKTAEPSGYSKWITSDKSRAFVHRLRFLSTAILIGATTLKRDNPYLNTRNGLKVIDEPYKIVVSENLQLDFNSNIFKIPEKVIIVTSEKNREKVKDYNVITLPETFDKKLDFTTLNKALYKKGIYTLLAEGGSTLTSYLLKYKCVDKIYIFYGNSIMGGKDSIPMVGGDIFFPLQNPLKIDIKGVKKISSDIMLKGYPLYHNNKNKEF